MFQQRWEAKIHRKENSPQPGIKLRTTRSWVRHAHHWAARAEHLSQSTNIDNVDLRQACQPRVNSSLGLMIVTVTGFALLFIADPNFDKKFCCWKTAFTKQFCGNAPWNNIYSPSNNVFSPFKEKFYPTCDINPLPNDKILEVIKLKELADNKSNVARMMRRSRKHCGIRRKCWLPAFSPFLTIFSKAFFFGVVKSWDCVVRS